MEVGRCGSGVQERLPAEPPAGWVMPCSGLDCGPPKRICPLRTSDGTLFGIRDFANVIKVGILSRSWIEWAINATQAVLIETGKEKPQTWGAVQVREEEILQGCSYEPSSARWAGSHQSLEEARKCSPLETSG